MAYRLACILFWSILLYFVCQRYVVSIGIVTDRSMLPTLSEGSYYLINKYGYRFGHPKRGDLMVLRKNSDSLEQYIKRVIGLQGETLLIHTGTVFINGRPLAEPYAVGRTYPDLGPIVIGPGYYFVTGDNREASEDSRYFGPVARRDIEGKVTPGQLFSLQ